MHGTKAPREHTTLMVEEFPVALRLQIRAKALVERRPMRDVFVELLERALAQEAKGKERKP